MRALLQAHRSKLEAVRQFVLAQGVTVAGNLLYGLLCVHLLMPAEYAQFVVLFSVQGTLVILMDVGISGSLIPLVGERVDDRRLIADYVASLRRLAVWLYVALAAGLIVLYPLLVRNRHWPWQVVAGMVATLLISTWCMRVGAAYGSVLILLGRRQVWYRGQMIASLGTLAALGIAWALGRLGAFTAIEINVAGIVFTGWFYWSRARRLLGTPGTVSRSHQRAIVRLALPNVPGIVFYALQGQLALLLITVFGRTAGVAGIGALSRLGQIFVLFSQMNPLLVEPYFARLPRGRLRGAYAGALLLAGMVCGVVALSAWVWPAVFLLILGPSYAGLRVEAAIVVTSSALAYFTNVLWVIHSARRFVFWWANALNIALTIAVQVWFILRADLAAVRSVVELGLATVVVALITNLASGLYGLARGPRRIGDEPAQAPALLAEANVP